MAITLSGVARFLIDSTEIAHEISCTLSMEVETKERETKDTSGTEVRAGKASWSASGNGLQVESNTDSQDNFSDLFDALQAKTSVAFEFSTGTSGDTYYFGQLLLTSLEVTSEVNEDPVASWSGTGDGAIQKGTVV